MELKSAQKCALGLTLIPPCSVTTKVPLDIRGSIFNNQPNTVKFSLMLYLDSENKDNLIFSDIVSIDPGKNAGFKTVWPTNGKAGKHEILLVAESQAGRQTISRPVWVIESCKRSTEKVEGAWMSIVHWSDAESRLWRQDNLKMTDEQWRESVRGMKELGFNTIVIQELFRNEMYVGKHKIDRQGYKGKAFYPSELYSERMELAANNPVEAILSEADKLEMHVFPGVGLYAWFDFSEGSLNWHKQVSDELWKLYGHHRSFYGWYVSEEIFGNLGEKERHRNEIVNFFEAFTAHCRKKSPDKPIMLAPNCHKVPEALDYWPKLLKNLDIVCPFGFHRMPAGDITGEQAAAILQRLCDDSGTHLWMDMEAFLFAKDRALYPRPIDGLVDDLMRFPNFEKILCYQYMGLFNAPWASIKPGGEDTVKLFNDYKRFLESRERAGK